MQHELSSRLHPHALAAMILVAGLIATWLAYAPAMGGSLHFDDYPSLEGLATVDEPGGTLRFIASGIAGPSGRPVALASFVPQAYAWPQSPEVFLHTNVMIHLLNGVLVTWFLYLLGLARRQTETKAALVAAGSGAIWMLMPILASSSLFIVQRMTTLSAMWVLLGAVGYMYARQAIDRRPTTALIGMTIAIGLGAVLGALSKENGILLFLFILAVEATLLAPPKFISIRLWRTWFSVVLVGPLLLLSIYLISVLQYPEATILRRDFNGYERLVTQAGVLWKYLYVAFLPNVSSLGPFHDDYPTQKTLFTLTTLLANTLWLAAVATAVVLRKKAPLLTFAIAWYLLGHLLESTTIGLELYFEHRNYLPLVGPVYALMASILNIAKKWQRLAGIGAAVYGGMLWIILLNTTSLWGTPALSAEMWHIYKPDSLRAVIHLAGRLHGQGDEIASLRLLSRYLEANPEAHGIRLRMLVISCQLAPDSDHNDAVLFLKDKLPVTRFDPSVGPAIQQLLWLARNDRCRSIPRSEIYQLGQRVLENPRFNLPIVRHNIHTTLAMASIDEGDFEAGMYHLESALAVYPNPDTLLKTIDLLNGSGMHAKSWSLLHGARGWKLSRNPLRVRHLRHELDRIETFLISSARQPEHYFE